MAEGHRRRVMEKIFRHGIESLYEHEFLELCLFYVYKRKDTNPIAHALLNKFGNLENLCNAPEKEIAEVEGVGKAAAEFIKMLPLISKGYSLHTSVKKRKVYEHKSDIENRCIALLKDSVNEKAYLLCFDDGKRLIKEVEISEGEPGGVNISMRKIMDAIANTSTTSVVLCHNHPSGILLPSNEDMRATSKIKMVLESANIELIDHYIVSEGKQVSCISMN